MECPNPECGRNKFFYNPYREKGHCKVCGTVVSNKKRFVEAFNLTDVDDWPGLAVKPPVPKYEHSRRIEAAIPAWWNPKARRILRKGRGFSEKVVAQSKILYSPKTNQLVADVTTTTEPPQEHKLVRSADLHGKWQPIQPGMSLSDFIWGANLVPAHRKCVIVFEGIFDVLSTRTVGYGIAMLGSTIQLHKQDWLSRHFKEVILWMDPDEGGKKGLKAVRTMRGLGLEVHVVDESQGDPKYADLTFCRELKEYCRSVT